MVSQAINTSFRSPKGPVHINIPLREPLYDLAPYDDANLPKVIEEIYPTSSIDATTMVNDDELASLKGKRIAIVLGSHSPSNTLKSIIKKIASRQDVLVMHETLANVSFTSGISLVDPLVEYIHENKAYHLLPDLVITMGNAVVSKKLKFLFKQRNTEHWHITPSPMYWDRFNPLQKSLWQSLLTFFIFWITIYQNPQVILPENRFVIPLKDNVWSYEMIQSIV